MQVSALVVVLHDISISPLMTGQSSTLVDLLWWSVSKPFHGLPHHATLTDNLSNAVLGIRTRAKGSPSKTIQPGWITTRSGTNTKMFNSNIKSQISQAKGLLLCLPESKSNAPGCLASTLGSHLARWFMALRLVDLVCSGRGRIDLPLDEMTSYISFWSELSDLEVHREHSQTEPNSGSDEGAYDTHWCHMISFYILQFIISLLILI